MNNQQRINEFKKKAGFIQYATESVSDVSSLDYRVVKGYAAKWGNKDLDGDKILKGAFQKSIKDRGPESQAKFKIKLLNQHKQDQPLANIAVLKEDDYGLYFESEPLDDVPWANHALVQLKSGTINSYSVGYNPVWAKAYIDSKDDSIVHPEGDLFEISVATIPANLETYTIKSKEEIDELFENAENFINSLPRKEGIEARKLFQKYKSLAQTEPPTLLTKALNEEDKPILTIDYAYLLKNLKQ